MANIAITNYCNLKCPYCFADDMIKEQKRAITIDDFQRILNFLGKSDSSIGIIGGEPTIHPQFQDILLMAIDYAATQDHPVPFTLFTNGIELAPYVDLIHDNNLCEVLLNFNSPKGMTALQYKKVLHVIDLCHEKYMLSSRDYTSHQVGLGVNIYLDNDDYSYVWEIVDKYHIPEIRLGVTAPGGQYFSWLNKKDEYYKKIKDIFIRVCAEALQHNCLLRLDCNRIPKCYFNIDERMLLSQSCVNLFKTCRPIIDITANFQATACFGTYGENVDIRNFDNIEQIDNYFMFKRFAPLIQKNLEDSKCKLCRESEILTCQNGCLAFSK